MRQRTPLRHYAAQSRNRASPMRFKNRYLSLQLFLNPIPQLDPKQRIHAVALDRAAGINILDALRQYRQRFRELPDQRLDDDVRGVGKGGGVREQGTGILLFSLDFARSTTFGRSGSDFVPEHQVSTEIDAVEAAIFTGTSPDSDGHLTFAGCRNSQLGSQ
ncbi:hypothetical protein MMC21_008258 [Puttea exsequens]|nr:hypothetical protein [Puttea exsequens]